MKPPPPISTAPGLACLDDPPWSRYAFCGLLALAAGLRIAAFLDLKYSVYFDFMLWDERLYHEWARRIADGTFASGEVYEFAPLPAYFMALVYRLFGPEIVYIRYANIVFGVALCALVYLVGRELGGRRVGLAAMFLAAVYKPFVLYSVVPLKTALALVLFAAAVYTLLAAVNERGALFALFLGFFLQLATNVRPNAVVLVPVAAVVLATVRWHRRRAVTAVLLLALYAGGVALAQAPFTLRNYLAAGEAALTTSQAGFHLYLAHNHSYPQGIPFVTTSPRERGVMFTIEASRRTGRTLTAQEASRYWRDQALTEMRHHPWAELRRAGRQLLLLFHWYEKADHYQMDFIERFVPFLRWPLVPFWVVMPLAMAGLVAVRRERSRAGFALAAVSVGYAVGLVVFFTNIRMRLPLLVVFIPLAALAVSRLADDLATGRRRRVWLPAAVAAAFLAVAWLPVRDTRDLTGAFNTHAIVLKSRGREAEALEWWERSSALDGRFSAFANLSLCQYQAHQGDFDQAHACLDRIRDDSFAAALKYEQRGDLLMAQRQVAAAVRAYERALALNPGLRGPRLKLARIFERIDPRRAGVEYAKLGWVDRFYERYMTRSPRDGG